MSYLSVSTWSLHRLLGPLRWTYWDEASGQRGTSAEEQPEILSLLELPAEAARRGYSAIEICHFHFPSTEPAYLRELAAACDLSGISFDTLLLDYGDLTSPSESRRSGDLAYAKDWIEIAAQAGARRVRIIAGEAEPTDAAAIERSANALNELGRFAEPLGVRVVTENFKSLTSTGASCAALLERLDSRVGMITDFGNFKPPAKYEDLPITLPRSLSVHVKPIYDEQGMPDEDELARCLDLVREADWDGALVLIYDGPGDMWDGLERVRRLVAPYVTNS